MADFIGPVQYKRATSAAWAASTVPLREGEPGIDTTVWRMKVGDGATLWAGLNWVMNDQSTIAQLQQLSDDITAAGSVTDAQIKTQVTTPSSLTAQALTAQFAPGGTAGTVSKPTAQGIALVQALIFGA